MTPFYSIQSLRALAALAVVLFHISMVCGGWWYKGWMGVDIFFVISGFIMGTVGTHDRPKVFLLKRAIRLVPLYWAMTLGMCVLSLVPGLFAQFSFTGVTLFKSLFFIPHFNPEGKIWPLLVAGWSLNYEMLFYVLFAVGLYYKRPIVIASGLLGALMLMGPWVPYEHPIEWAWTDPMLTEFVAGLWLSQARMVRGRGLGLGLIVCSVVLYSITMGHVVSWGWMLGTQDDSKVRVLYAGLPGLLLVSGAVALERAGQWRRMVFAEAIGDASYSLYLLHGLVIAAIHKIFYLPAGMETVLILAVSVVASLLCYRFLNGPLRAF